MNTPVWDFLEEYRKKGMTRFHMPGHKGTEFLGCESLDLTEVQGADSLYEAKGIIARSEANAAKIFDSAATLFSTEGSSQCIRAMLYLALTERPAGTAPVIAAARNVHKAFVYAAALLDFQIVWLWPEGGCQSVCGCPVSPQSLEHTLNMMDQPPAAVYVTSPDYLGNMADIPALAEVCHRHGTILAVDNAHGAYLRFLKPSLHPLDLGADICCDSAHKTLPVLTGGAYLHLGKQICRNRPMAEHAKMAMALFGSTSPSYLTLASLDRCNRYLAEGYQERLAETTELLAAIRAELTANGWKVEHTDPLRLTISAPACTTGTELADLLRQNGIESEYADPEFLVLMITPENQKSDLRHLVAVLSKNQNPQRQKICLPLADGPQVVSVREAMFSPCQVIAAHEALGRICGAPTVSCPPAIPIAVSGERIEHAAMELFQHYGVESVAVLKEK